MNKKTAVEWLHETFVNATQTELKDNINLFFKQAKEMEKEQIIFTHISRCNFMSCEKPLKEKLKCSCGQYFWEQNFKKTYSHNATSQQ